MLPTNLAAVQDNAKQQTLAAGKTTPSLGTFIEDHRGDSSGECHRQIPGRVKKYSTQLLHSSVKFKTH